MACRDPSTTLDSLSSRAIHSIGICALVVALSGCVPLAPYARGPGSIESHGPLGEDIPVFIVAGETTRQQVLVHLGAPQIEAIDGSWSYYESDYLKSESGAWYLIAIPFLAGTIARIPDTNEFSFRRLYIAYTADSRVSSASFAEQKCHDVYKYSHIEFPSKPDAAKCPILHRHLDLKQARLSERMESAIPSGQGVVQWFEHALWHRGQGDTCWASLTNCSVSATRIAGWLACWGFRKMNSSFFPGKGLPLEMPQAVRRFLSPRSRI